MNKKTDDEIKQQVLRELKWDSRIPWSEIGVEVFEGVVTLTGNVNSNAKKRAAQEAAHRIDGVLDVANEIEVRPTGEFLRTESDIALAVRQVLQWDALVPDGPNACESKFTMERSTCSVGFTPGKKNGQLSDRLVMLPE